MAKLRDSYYLICSAATEGSIYVDCLEQQKKHFKGFNYKSFVLPDRGSWEENTKLKPQAIRKAFEHADNVLWVDSDCLLDPPDNKPEVVDVGIFDNIHPEHKCRVSASYIFFRNTKNTQDFLSKWERYNKYYSKDHPAFMKVLKRADRCWKIKNITPWLEGRQHFNVLAKARGHYEG
jgi:hypothetical protein